MTLVGPWWKNWTKIHGEIVNLILFSKTTLFWYVDFGEKPVVKTKDSLGPLSELSHVRSGKVFVYMVVLEADMDASFLTCSTFYG